MTPTILALAALFAAPAFAVVKPQPQGPIVASVVAQIFAHGHYSHHPVDDEISSRTLRGYIEDFDYNHMFFLKSDVDGFEARYKDSLDDDVRAGNLAPAYEIFQRFLQRLEERDAWVHEFAASTYTFTGHERMPLELHKGGWPATRADARKLWRLEVEYELLQAKLNDQKSTEAVKNLLSHYDEVVHSYKQFEGADVVQAFLSAFSQSFDPHSDYMGAPQEENFDISMRLSLFGIGALLREDEGLPRVVSLVPGGAADRGKRLKANDRIEAVSQGDGPWVEVSGIRLDHVVQLIRGPKGTLVRLRVIPSDAVNPSVRTVVPIVRDEIHLKDQEAKASLVTRPGPDGVTRRIGVIDLPSFYADMSGQDGGKSTTEDVGKLLSQLERKGIDGLILDLRNNGGGALKEAIDLAGLFIPAGPVVQVKDGQGEIQVLDDPGDEPVYRGPMVVLTSRESASASEIVTAALQDYGRAVVVGNKSTFGKGTVQAVVSLKPYMPPNLEGFDPGALRLTTQKFYRVSGGSTQDKGVIPDIRLPSIEDYLDISENSMNYAMPYDSIPEAPHTQLDQVQPLLPSLEKASKARVAASPEFDYVREDIAKYRKHKADKSVSLNEAEREAERKADEAVDTQRKKERVRRGPLKEQVLEITLEDLAGKVVSSTGTVAAVTPSTGTAKGDYEKAPPAPDVILEEAENVVSDMVADTRASAGAPVPASVH
ncbi:MAG: carboxy terminal-processing peptidase [Elusimicrobia bacterium]|nr:carboxy terminal-processing peptidase [Elusimicrobiota bacterium]